MDRLVRGSSSLLERTGKVPQGGAVAHRPPVARPTVAGATKLVTYAATLASVYLSIGFLFYYAAKEKLTAGAMPAPLKKEFAGSLFASIPGDNAAWVLLGLIEASIVVLLVVSLIRVEFLATRHKPFLLTGLSVAMFATALMGFTNDMVHDVAHRGPRAWHSEPR